LTAGGGCVNNWGEEKMSLTLIREKLKAAAKPEDALAARRFFKTGPGEYGEGDRFVGVRVPVLRKMAREFKTLSIEETETLLQSEYHEERHLALFILILLYKKGDADSRRKIFDIYLKNTPYINNWDLVDASAEHIVGDFLKGRDKDILFRLALSENLWERRIAILSTFGTIKSGQFATPLQILEILVHDPHELIHKAGGWMLREIGNRDLAVEESFLKRHYKTMPRTMLRYAIEKFPEEKRKAYLTGAVT
jgi:3-methyladenine DNA glycosylase AlkD